MEMDQKAFIGRISQALGHDKVPEHITPSYDYSKGLQYSRLQGLDAAGVRELLAEQQKVRDFTMLECNKAELGTTIAGILEQEAPARVVVPADTASDDIDLLALTKDAAGKAEVYAYDKKNDATTQRATIEQADVSITIPYRAVADTGHFLEIADVHCGKVVSLLPPAHIAIVYQSRLRATLTELAPELDAMGEEGKMPTYFLFVSGPSSTGDIESVMVTGVHGPTREYTIVVKDM